MNFGDWGKEGWVDGVGLELRFRGLGGFRV